MSEVAELFKAYYWSDWYEEWNKRSHEIHLFTLDDELYAKFKIKLKGEPQITQGVTGFSIYGELKIYTT
jgi:hypothetical protein